MTRDGRADRADRVRRIAECVAAVDDLPAGTVVLDGRRRPAELADDVLSSVARAAGSNDG